MRVYEIQKAQMQTPLPKKKKSFAAIVWRLTGWKEALKKEAEPPGNQQADWKSAVHLDSEKGQKHPKLYEFAFVQHSQLIERDDFLELVLPPQNKKNYWKMSEFSGKTLG